MKGQNSLVTNTFCVRDVVLVDFPIHIPPGHEQQGQRPAVIVASQNEMATTRFSLLVVVPTTTQAGEWVIQNSMLYSRLQAGAGAIRRESIVLLDQIRALDVQRVLRYWGTLTPEQYQPIEDGLKAMLRL